MSKTVDIGTATVGMKSTVDSEICDIPQTKETKASFQDMEGEILAVRSKNGQYTAFTKCVGEDKQVLHIYNQSMKKLDDVKVGDDILGSDIMSLEWMGEKQIAVMSHISPTTGCLDVYDVEKKENVFHVNCTDYAWSNEVESIVYVEPVSRFQTGNIHLLDYRGNVLYETGEKEMIEDIKIGKNGKKILELGILDDGGECIEIKNVTVE